MPWGSGKVVAALRPVLLAGAAIGLALPAVAGEQPTSPEIGQLLERFEQLERRQAEQAAEIEAQKRVIEDQNKEIEAQRLLHEPPPPLGHSTAVPANVVTGGDEPGPFELPGSDTSIKIGGYVKGDPIYDIGADTGDSFAASAIPADGNPGDKRDGRFRAHARQTRINLTTWTPTDYGEVETLIEGDFFVKIGLDTLPDFVAAVEYGKDGWNAKFSGVARLLELEGAGTDPESEFGRGVHASAVIPTFGKDSPQLDVTYGDGIGRYIINGVGNDAFVDAAGRQDTMQAYGIAVGCTRQWSETGSPTSSTAATRHSTPSCRPIPRPSIPSM